MPHPDPAAVATRLLFKEAETPEKHVAAGLNEISSRTAQIRDLGIAVDSPLGRILMMYGTEPRQDRISQAAALSRGAPFGSK